MRFFPSVLTFIRRSLRPSQDSNQVEQIIVAPRFENGESSRRIASVRVELFDEPFGGHCYIPLLLVNCCFPDGIKEESTAWDVAGHRSFELANAEVSKLLFGLRQELHMS